MLRSDQCRSNFHVIVPSECNYKRQAFAKLAPSPVASGKQCLRIQLGGHRGLPHLRAEPTAPLRAGFAERCSKWIPSQPRLAGQKNTTKPFFKKYRMGLLKTLKFSSGLANF